MEKAGQIVSVPGSFGWEEIGILAGDGTHQSVDGAKQLYGRGRYLGPQAEKCHPQTEKADWQPVRGAKIGL
jgi:hypothetical protein